MIIKPAIGFVSTDPDSLLVTDTKTIIVAMTSNPSYPSPSPTLASITTANSDFATAIADAANGGKELTAIKNAKRAALSALLRELASYVHVACKGDLAVLLSSGFPIQKPTRTPVGVLPPPVTPVLSLGSRSGEMDAYVKPITNASLYSWRVALASSPDTYVIEEQTTAASIVFDGLTPGQVYLVDANAIGSAGPSDWSDAAQLMVV